MVKIPFGGTFLVFADYERPALRLGALQNIRVIRVYTRFLLCWRGWTTHQPIEHVMSLRTMPNFNVLDQQMLKKQQFVFV